MGVKKYFFDSYTLIEIMKGNQDYARFVQEEVIITIFNLVEVHYSSLNYLTEAEAEQIFSLYRGNAVDVSDETLIQAMKFKKLQKKRNLSYADCIGYVYSLQNDLWFLTGDKAFEGMDHVEFVK